MKILVVIFSCILFVAGVSVTEDKKAEILEELSKCAEEAGASDDDMEKIVAHQIPESKNGLCTMACFMKKHDMMTAENAMDIEGVKTFMKKVMPHHDDVPEELVKAMEDCNEELTAEKDECDAAKNIIECVMPKIHEHVMGKKLTE